VQQRRIIDLAIQDTAEDLPQPIHEPEEKVISKVATLFGILEQLGFTSTRIQECLEKVKTMELDDCLDWMFLHCDAEELACEGPIITKQSYEFDNPSPLTTTTTTTNGGTPAVAESAGPSSPPSPTSKDNHSKRSLSTTSFPSLPTNNPTSPRQPRSRTVTSSNSTAPTPAPAQAPVPNKEVASTFADLRARILAAEEKKNDKKKKKRSLKVDASTESSPSPVSSSASSSSDEEEDRTISSTKEPTPSTPASEPEIDEEEEEADDLSVDSNARYASIKLQLSEIQRAQGASKRAGKGKGDRKGGVAMSKEQEEWIEGQAEGLRKKIKDIEGDYTFRKTDAEKLYREERTKLDAAQLSARLNGTTLESSVPEFPTSIATPVLNSEEPSTPATNGTTTASSPPSPSLVNGGSTGEGGEGGNGGEEGFFGGLLEEMPAEEETTEEGTTIPIRNLSLPKHFSGKTPKASLEETVRKLDKPASVKFNVTSRSRAVRANVTIKWSDGRVQAHEMNDIACWDQPQAYNYIATIALFTVAGQTAVNKQLPTVFRDLWDELVAKKKEEDEDAYREKLKLYKKIAEPRMQEQGNKVRLISSHNV